MKQDIRYNPIDPARENGKVYPNHPNKIDIDMQMFQEAFIARRDVRRLNTAFWTFTIGFSLFCLVCIII
jgi:hypothetical protein